MQNLTSNIVYADVFLKTSRIIGYVAEMSNFESVGRVQNLIDGGNSGVLYIAITRIIVPALDIDATIECDDAYDKIIKTLQDYVDLLTA